MRVQALGEVRRKQASSSGGACPAIIVGSREASEDKELRNPQKKMRRSADGTARG